MSIGADRDEVIVLIPSCSVPGLYYVALTEKRPSLQVMHLLSHNTERIKLLEEQASVITAQCLMEIALHLSNNSNSSNWAKSLPWETMWLVKSNEGSMPSPGDGRGCYSLSRPKRENPQTHS